MIVVRCQKWCLHVYANDHLPPHCHVRFCDKSEIVVTIPFIEPMYGATISREVKESIVNNIEELADAWDRFHAQRQYN